MFRSSLCVASRPTTSRCIHSSTPAYKKLKIPDKDAPPKKRQILTPKELALNTARRIQKAERDERMDISMSLTEVKTYEAGFTKPRILRASNWFPGGEYIRKEKVYEKPPEDAYQPYTVYILESRYPVKTKEPGRPDVPEHIVGVCRERHFTSLIKQKNSPGNPGISKVSMDAAWWPFLKRRPTAEKRQIWWDKDEDPNEARLKALAGDEEGATETFREFYPSLNKYRNNGTLIVEPTPTKTIHPLVKPQTIGEIREMYEPTLATEPFWRPLISVTLATRPLGDTLVRLCRALPRGLAFYASIEPDDRKTFHSFPARMRLLRLQRIRNLTIQLARRLEGYQGGFIGIRFSQEDRGRGIRGERLREPLPDPLRVIRVGVANWYKFERERELWELAAVDGEVDIDIRPMDEWGRKLEASGEVMAGQEAVEGAIIESEEGESEDGAVEAEENEESDDENDDAGEATEEGEKLVEPKVSKKIASSG
ncbi:hypothetical protein BDV93DRAFT_606909 [Ceratobasidium sp. AG-I]|nr:hypothetical protein BDV93DRAFT_606909 [Ceratobasidium sp. AG-I]